MIFRRPENIENCGKRKLSRRSRRVLNLETSEYFPRRAYPNRFLGRLVVSYALRYKNPLWDWGRIRSGNSFMGYSVKIWHMSRWAITNRHIRQKFRFVKKLPLAVTIFIRPTPQALQNRRGKYCLAKRARRTSELESIYRSESSTFFMDECRKISNIWKFWKIRQIQKKNWKFRRFQNI